MVIVGSHLADLSVSFILQVQGEEKCWRQCVNMLWGRGCVCGLHRGEQRYNLCLWVQAGLLTVCISQARPAHSEIYWHALIKHQGRRQTPQHTSAGLSNQREGMTTRLLYLHETEPHFDANYKCLLTVNHKEDGNRLFNVRDRFFWSHFTAWLTAAIISKSASFRVIMAATEMQ